MQRRSSGVSFGADLAPIAPLERKSNSTEDMTINKLRFDNVGIRGRTEEMARLKQCWKNTLETSTSTVQRQLVLLTGYSGTGQSELARSLKDIVERDKGLYVSGKCSYYDATTSDSKGRTPYSGITGACSEICSAIKEQLRLENSLPVEEGATPKTSGICDQLKEGLGAQLNLMIQMVPNLMEILKHDSYHSNDNVEAGGPEQKLPAGQDCTESKHQLQFAC